MILGLAALAVFVQLAVWGATKLRADGALLASWQPWFGWPYGLVFAAVQAALCRVLRLERGLAWLVVAWASTIPFCLIGWASGHRPGIDAAVALSAGLGALALAVGVLDNRLAPAPRGDA